MEVNKNNIEEQILLYVDGELNAHEAKALLQYITLHPEWHSLLEEYKSLVMQPDTDIVFEAKEALLQPEEGRVIAFKKRNSFKKIGWAAAAVLLIGAAGLTWMQSRRENGPVLPEVATAVLPKQNPAVAINVTADTGKAIQQTPPPAKTYKAAQAAQAAQPVLAHTATTVRPKVQRKDTDLSPITGNTLAAINSKDKPLPAQEIQRPDVLLEAAPEEVVAQQAELPNWLPVNSEKLEGVNDLVTHIKVIKEKVAAKAALISKSTFVLRFGEKEIAFGK